MAQLRGIDVIGQGLLRGIPGLAESLNQYVMDQKQKQDIQSLLSELDQRSQPQQTGFAPQGGIQNPNGMLNPLMPTYQPGTPMLDEKNIGVLSQLPPQIVQMLHGLQPKFQDLNPGSVPGQVDQSGNWQQTGPQVGFRPSATSTANDWRGLMDETGQPVLRPLPGTNKTYQPEVKWADANDHSKGLIYKGVSGTQPTAGGRSATMLPPDGIDAIVEAIHQGKQPPDINNLRFNAAAVRARMQTKYGEDLTAMDKDWKATTKHLSTANSSTQLRMRQAVTTVEEVLPKIESLWAELKQQRPPSGYKAWNKLALAAAREVPGRIGQVSQNLNTLLTDFIPELGYLYMGGTSPTDKALALAAENLKQEWSSQTFDGAINILKNNIRVRHNSINNTGPIGSSGETNKYWSQPKPTGPTAGVVEDGYKFKGGDPSNPANWEKVQ